MKTILVDKLGGLDNQNADHNVALGNAVVAKYFDPFRIPAGKLSPCFGFKENSPTGWSNLNQTDSDAKFHAAFMFAGYECYIFNNGAGLIYMAYKDDDDVIHVLNQELGTIDFIPTKIVIDDNPYILGNPEDVDYMEFFNIYLYGYNNYTDNHTEPIRIMLTKLYVNPGEPPSLFWNRAGFAMWGFAVVPFHTFTVTATVGLWGNPDADAYHFFIIFEDAEGNYYTKLEGDLNDENAFHQIYYGSLVPQIGIQLNTDCTEYFHICKVHIYRVNYTDENAITPVEGIADLFSRARWRITIKRGELYGTGIGWENDNIAWRDLDASDAVLGDNVYPGWNELIAWQQNANEAPEAIGKHNNALWIGKGNTVYFSAYTLEAPYGARLLNFPTENRWRFEGIGDIVDLVSVDHNLVVFGTRGISILTGTYLDNFYERRISDIGILKPRGQYSEWINLITVIDNRAYFLDNNGYPCVYYNGTVQRLLNIRIPIYGDVESYPGQDPSTGYILAPIDTCRYRNGWIISNGTSMYVLDLDSGNWHEWPYAVHRFIQGLDPFYEDITLSTTAANEISYMRLIPNTAGKAPVEYATDGTIQTSYWKIPKITFDNDVIIKTITLYWEYKLIYNYKNKDMDEVDRTAQDVVMSLNAYIDDSDTSVKTIDFEPSENSDGKYKSTIYVNVRCRKFAFQLSGTAMKYARLTGYAINYEDRGRKTYD